MNSPAHCQHGHRQTVAQESSKKLDRERTCQPGAHLLSQSLLEEGSGGCTQSLLTFWSVSETPQCYKEDLHCESNKPLPLEPHSMCLKREPDWNLPTKRQTPASSEVCPAGEGLGSGNPWKATHQFHSHLAEFTTQFHNNSVISRFWVTGLKI